MEENKKTVHIYYNDSLDGKMSAAYYFQYIKRTNPSYNKTVLYEVHPNEDIDISDVLEGDMLVFLDYPFSMVDNWNIFIAIIRYKKNHVIWFDHHDSSKRLLSYFKNRVNSIESSYIYDNISNGGDVFYYREKLLDVFYYNNYSTTYALWCYCNSKINDNDNFLVLSVCEPSLIVKYIDSYSCNKRSLKNTIEFKYGISDMVKNPKKIHRKLNYPNSLELFDGYNNDILELENNIIKTAIEKGKIIKRYLHIINKKFINSSGIKFNIKIGNDNYKCIGLNTKSNSLIFEDLIYEYDIVCTFHMIDYYGSPAWEYALFSSKEFLDNQNSCFDISSVMRNYKFHISSGGTPNAAGFTLDKLIIKPDSTIKIYKNIFGRFKLKIIK